MVRLWSLYRGSGMGAGHLPDAGGTGDQPAIMMDAFGLMTGVAAKLDEEDKERRRRRR